MQSQDSVWNESIQLKTSMLTQLITSRELLSERVQRVWGSLVEQLAECHIHSLATQRVQETQEKWEASRDYSFTFSTKQVVPSLSEGFSYSCTKLPSLNRAGGSTFTLYSPYSLPLAMGVGQQQ